MVYDTKHFVSKNSERESGEFKGSISAVCCLPLCFARSGRQLVISTRSTMSDVLRNLLALEFYFCHDYSQSGRAALLVSPQSMWSCSRSALVRSWRSCFAKIKQLLTHRRSANGTERLCIDFSNRCPRCARASLRNLLEVRNLCKRSIAYGSDRLPHVCSYFRF